MMIRHLTWFLTVPLMAQSVIEDFRCRTAIEATNGNPTVLRCNEPHGWDNRPAQATLTIGTNPLQPGDAVSIGGLTYTFVSELNNSAPRQVLISSNRGKAAQRLAAAINDSGQGKGTGYSSATTAHPTVATLPANFSSTPFIVDLGTDIILWRDHGAKTGDPFRIGGYYSPMPAPWQYGATYYVIKVDDDRFKVAATAEDATNGVAIDLATATGGQFLAPVGLTCPSCFAEFPVESGAVWLTVYSLTPGAAGDGIEMTASAGGRATWDAAATRRTFWAYITGASGSWAGLGSDTAPKGWQAKVVDDTQFSVTFNSSSSGSFNGQNIRIRSANGDGLQKVYSYKSITPEVVDTYTANHTLGVVVPGCTPGMSEVECSKAFWTPEWGQRPGYYKAIQSFVVSGPTITIGLASPWESWVGPGVVPIQPGTLIFVRGYRRYATSTNPGIDGTSANYPGQAAANMFAGWAGPLRGFFIKTMSADRRTLTLANPGLADGTYIGNCQGECSVNTANWSPYVVQTDRANPYIYVQNRAGGDFWPRASDWWNTKNPLSFDSMSNRLRYWIKFGKNIPGPFDAGGMNYNMGTYVKSEGADNSGIQGPHYYHYMSIKTYKDRWHMFEMNSSPNHQRNGTQFRWPNNPTGGQPYYPRWSSGAHQGPPAAPRGYMASQTTYYQDAVGYASDWSGQVLHYADFHYDAVSGEPEETVRSRMIVWSPERYMNGVLQNSPGYHLFFQAAASTNSSYAIRYSASGSIKANGWSSGQDGGTVNPFNPSVNRYGVEWLSPTMDEQENFWVAIRPTLSVAGVSGQGQSPIWISTAVDMGIQAGDTVTISGVGGNTAANQDNVPVTAARGHRYFYRWVPRREYGPSLDGELASIIANGGTCTANFTVEHNLVPGMVIEVGGSSHASLGTLYPVRFTVSGVPSSSSLTFSCPGVPNGTYDDEGDRRASFVLIAYPAVAIEGTGNQNYSSGGTIVTTSETRGFAEIRIPKYTPFGAAPRAPSMLAASGGSKQVQLSWPDEAGDEHVYVVERQVTDAQFEPVATLAENTTSYTDVGLVAGTTYIYRVKAVNAAGESAYSPVAMAATEPPPSPPVPPTTVYFLEVLADRVKVGWADASNVEAGFEIEMSVNGGVYQPVIRVPANTVEQVVEGLIPLTSYRLRVRAVNDVGPSSWVESIQVTTLPEVAWRLEGLGSGGAVISYDAPTDQTCTLEVEGPGQSASQSTDKMGVRARVRAITGLLPDSQYDFLLRCEGQTGAGRFTTRPLESGDVSFPVSSSAPVAVSLDNMVVDAGATVESMTALGSAACTSGRCSLLLNMPIGQVQWIRQRWCRNRLSDPNCTNPSNELRRSQARPVVM
jgi:hypothetical protein